MRPMEIRGRNENGRRRGKRLEEWKKNGGEERRRDLCGDREGAQIGPGPDCKGNQAEG